VAATMMQRSEWDRKVANFVACFHVPKSYGFERLAGREVVSVSAKRRGARGIAVFCSDLLWRRGKIPTE
jgi:hypothetical protein